MIPGESEPGVEGMEMALRAIVAQRSCCLALGFGSSYDDMTAERVLIVAYGAPAIPWIQGYPENGNQAVVRILRTV